LKVAVQFRDTRWTYEDLKALPDDGKRFEIIEGVLYEVTGPSGKHVAALIQLNALMLPFVVALGGPLVIPVADVFFPGADPVQPDLAVLLPGGQARLTKRGVEGPPDLVVEVLSPSSRSHDTLTKRALYGRAGVREYWLADPDRETIEVLTLVGDSLHHAGLFAGDDRVRSSVLPELEFSAGAVFAGLDALGAEQPDR
jgi:Uma2 family endonuclease